MCRMIMAIGQVDITAVLSSALLMSEGRTARHNAPHQQHRDGWGAVIYDGDGKLRVHRSSRPIAEDASDINWSDNSQSFMAVHVRNATLPSNRGIEFTHPVTRTENDWLLMHNGYLPTIHREVGLTKSSFDSREYLDFLVPYGSRQLDSSKALSRLERLDPANTSGNALLINSERAYVLSWFPQASPFADYYTMWILELSEATIVSSEPLEILAPSRLWQPLPRGHCRAFALASHNPHS